MSFPNNNCPGYFWLVVWNRNKIEDYVADRITFQDQSPSTFLNSKIGYLDPGWSILW